MSVSPERWAPIPGFEGFYSVSTHGRVQSHYRRRGVMYLKPLVEQDGGHLAVNLFRPGQKMKRVSIHRLMMTAFVGPPPEGMEVRHLDGDPKNNMFENLVYGTRSENMLDRRAHGGDHNARKTHCPQGHEFTEANTYRYPSNGRRGCRICINAAGKAYRERKAASASYALGGLLLTTYTPPAVTSAPRMMMNQSIGLAVSKSVRP